MCRWLGRQRVLLARLQENRARLRALRRKRSGRHAASVAAAAAAAVAARSVAAGDAEAAASEAAAGDAAPPAANPPHGTRMQRVAEARRCARGASDPALAFMRAMQQPPRSAREPDVLIVGEYSAAVRQAMERRGHVALSCDPGPSDVPGLHYIGDARDLLALKRWRVVIGFPPCTNTACSGAMYFPEKRADGRQWWSMAFFASLLCADADAVLLEHPRSSVHQFLRAPDVVLHPYHFGVPKSKATGFWCAGSARPPQPTTVVEPQGGVGRDAHTTFELSRKERARVRSRLFPEVADAIAAAVNPDTAAVGGTTPDFGEVVRAMALRWTAAGHELPPSHDAAGGVPAGFDGLEWSLALEDAAPAGERWDARLRPQRAPACEAAAGAPMAPGPVVPLPVVHMRASASGNVLVLPVSTGNQDAVLLPAERGTFFGAARSCEAIERAKAAAIGDAAVKQLQAALQLEAPLGWSFMAGLAAGSNHHVAVVPSARSGDGLGVARAATPQELQAAAAGGAHAVWCTRAALHGDPRAELADAALVRTRCLAGTGDSVRADVLQTGTGASATPRPSAAEVAPAADFDARAARGTAALGALREELLRAAADTTSAVSEHVRECYGLWAAAVTPPPLDELPLELRSHSVSVAGMGLSRQPFAHRVPMQHTQPLQPPAPAPRHAESLEKVQHVRDLFCERHDGYGMIKRHLRRLATWHRRQLDGRPAKRPKPLALDTAVLTPAAKQFVDAGGVFDCRDPCRVRLLDPTEQPFESHLRIDGAGGLAESLAGCVDEELLSMMRGGVVLKAEVLPHIVIMPNLFSFYEAGGGMGVDAVTSALHDLVRAGWVHKCAAFIPFVPWRCAPRGAVPRPLGGEPRGIVDNGAPRGEKPLLTRPSGEVVVPVNVAAGPSRPPPGTPPADVKWHAEGKPYFQDACVNAAILADVAERAGEPVFTIAFDFAKFYHQCFLRFGEWPLAGSVVPDQRAPGSPASRSLVATVEKPPLNRGALAVARECKINAACGSSRSACTELTRR